MVERIKQLLAPPVYPEDNDKTRAAAVLNTLLLAILGLLIFNTTRALLLQFELVPFLLNAANLPVVFALLVFMRRGYVRSISLITVSLFWLIVTLISLIFTGASIIILSSYYVLVILAGLLLGRRASTLVMLLSIATSSLSFALETTGRLTIIPRDPIVDIISSLSLLVVMTVALNLTLSNLEKALQELRQKQTELEKAQSGLEERVAERTRDLNLASEGARSLAQIRNLDELLRRAVETVHNSFNLYYAQLYLLDEAARQLTLRAGTGVVGRRLLSQGHFLPLDLRTINGTAVLEKRPILVSDTGADQLFYPNPLLPDTRSEAAVPLLLGERVLGVLNMQSREPGAFSPDNVQVFETLAGQLAIALDNAQLLAAQQETAVSLQNALAQTEQQAHRLARLNELVTALDDAKEVGEVLAVANQYLPRLLPGDYVATALLTATGDVCEFFALEGEAGVRLVETWPLRETAVAHALHHNQIVQLPLDLPFDHFADTRQLAQTGMRSGLYAPLTASGKAIGAFILANTRTNVYTPAELDLLRQAANQFSVTLASRQLNERLSRLAAIVENNPDLVAISRLSGEIVYVNAAGLKLLGLPPHTDVTQLTAYQLTVAEDAQQLREVGLPAALETGVWSGEVQLKRTDGSVVPASQTIAIHYDGDQPESFFITLRDITERKQAQIAQQNLTTQLEERLIQVNALQRAMTREGWSAFMTASERLVHGYAFDGEALRLISRHDLKNNSLPTTLGETETTEEQPALPTNLASPIQVRGETVGVLGVRAPEGATISPMHQNLLQTIAQQLAEALERARLFEEMELARSQTDALYAGSEQVIQARSLDEVLRALVEHTRLRQFDRVDLVFFDSSWDHTPPHQLHVVSTWHKERQSAAIAEKRSFKLSRFPFLEEKYRHMPFVCENALTDERLDEKTRAFIMKAQNARSFLAFPLISGERWIGLVVAQSAVPQRLTEQSIRQVSSLVSQAATVSQTQRLFTEAQQRARREQTLREIATRVFAAADAESILRTAAQEISQTLGLETFVYLEEVDGTETAVSNGHDQLANAPEKALSLNAGE